MSRILLLFIALGYTASLSAAQLVYTNVQIVDPESKRIQKGSIFVEDGKVTKITNGVLKSVKGLQTIDLENRYIIPGLFDMHTHAWGNPKPTGSPMILGIEGAAKVMLYSGITGFLDLLSLEGEIFALRNKQQTEGLTAADIYAAGPCLTSPGGHCSEFPIPTRIIDSPAGGAAEIGELAKLNPNVVKIVYDHAIPNVPTITLETLKATLKATNEKGIPSVVHIGTWQNAREAIEAGATAVTHIYHEPIPDDVVQLAKIKKTVFIPTLGVQRTLLDIVEDPNLLNDTFLQELTTEEFLTDYEKIDLNNPRWKFYIEFMRKNRATNADSVKKLIDAGVTILPGTDIGNPGTFVGYSLHRELQLLVNGGMSTWEVLKGATIDSANFLGQKYGFKPGASANFVVLDSSPIDSIEATKSIVNVIYKGRIIDRDKLKKWK